MTNLTELLYLKKKHLTHKLTTFVTYRLRRALLDGRSINIDNILDKNDGMNDTV